MSGESFVLAVAPSGEWEKISAADMTSLEIYRQLGMSDNAPLIIQSDLLMWTRSEPYAGDFVEEVNPGATVIRETLTGDATPVRGRVLFTGEYVSDPSVPDAVKMRALPISVDNASKVYVFFKLVIEELKKVK